SRGRRRLACPGGLNPPTYGLEGRCSIRAGLRAAIQLWTNGRSLPAGLGLQWGVQKLRGFLPLGAVLGLIAGCGSAGGPVTVSGTGGTNQPVTGVYPSPTPEWWTPRPTPSPTPGPPNVLPSPTPSLPALRGLCACRPDPAPAL